MSGEGFYGGGTGEGFYTPLPIGEVVALVVPLPEVGVSAEVVAAGFVDVAVALVVPLPDVFEPTTLHAGGGVTLGGSARLRSVASGSVPLQAYGVLLIDGSAALTESVDLFATGSLGVGGTSWLTAAERGQYTMLATGGVALTGYARLRQAGEYMESSDIVWVADTSQPDALKNLKVALAGFPFKLSQITDLSLELDVAGGPLGASMSLAVPDLNTVPKLDAKFTVQYLGQSLYNGRLERVEVDLDQTCGYVLTFGPAMDVLRDKRDFRKCFADEVFADWARPTTTPKHDFSVDVTSGNTGSIGGGYIEAQAKWGSSYAGSPYFGESVGAWGDVAWRMYDGVGDASDIKNVELTYEWNGDLDPAMFTTDALPRYNLFPDPRAMAGGTDSSTWQLEPGDTSTGNSDNSGHSPVRGELTSPEPGRRANYFHWGWDWAYAGMDPGNASWDVSMAIPDDLQTQLKKDGSGMIWVGLWSASNRLASQDEILLFARDQKGNVLSETAMSLPQNPNWVYSTMGLGILAGTTELQMVAMLTVDPDEDGWRNICLPIVTNVPVWDYVDGFTEGWEWTGTTNNSASRQTDLTVSTQVLEEVAFFAGRGPLRAVLFAADDPTDPRPFTDPTHYPPPKIIASWWDPKKASGTIRVSVGARGLGLAIMVVGCPYTLTFKQPKDSSLECYGLKVTKYNVNGPTSAREALNAICGWGGFACDFQAGNTTLEQLYFKDVPKDGWDALDEVNSAVGADYFCWDGHTVQFRTPGTGTRRKLAVADPATVWSPESDLLEHFDSVLVTYTNVQSLPCEVRCGSSNGKRRDVIAAPASVTSLGAAKRLGEFYLSCHTGAELNGQMTVYGNQGHDDALLFRPGDMLTLTGPAKGIVQPAGLPRKPQEVIHVSLHPLTWEAQLQFGVNSKRYDMLVARIADGSAVPRR